MLPVANSADAYAEAAKADFEALSKIADPLLSADGIATEGHRADVVIELGRSCSGGDVVVNPKRRRRQREDRPDSAARNEERRQEAQARAAEKRAALQPRQTGSV